MPHHILIVEDSPVQRQMLAELCRTLPNAEVYEASDGRWAVQMMQKLPQIDLVITDINMPGMDGIALAQTLSGMVRLPALMFLSGDVPELLEGCLLAAEKLGFSRVDSMAKPLDPPIFFAKVQKLFQSRRYRSGPDVSIPLSEIMTGLAHNQFCAYYQPIFSQHRREATQLEALARWRHPRHGLLGPQYFIDRLEHEDAIALLSRRMAQTTLDFLDRNSWARSLRMSLNLSRGLLHDNEFLDWLLQEVEKRGIPPARLVLEITETLAFNNLGHTLASLLRLRMRGFELSLDDYGTGHTTLEHIRNLPLTELKLDRSLINNIHRDRRNRSILDGTVAMGSELGLRMVAEGIESRLDLEFLQQHYPMLELQGFYLCRPMPAAQLRRYLRWGDASDPVSA
ncbi:EAL domain-containing protein [Chromobacterium sp. IIBBL 290-4]|uniref:EAL domain-containing response regulator n=1 Tax=Chromobacterium sp. IIBBL 290-4 TaxID=2953890 RepID=UPI0020B7A0F7|nr:EAL domain-containing response regulator [Chromobacterium sp. IIBBL 290-4]UTH74687.1 EAL domain-containing response regulator [Chromobacterium sp. IIBBL 290-4]